jgi:hypothetical protein
MAYSSNREDVNFEQNLQQSYIYIRNVKFHAVLNATYI